MRNETGGPKTLTFVEFARQYQRAAAIHRPIVSFHISERTIIKMGFTENTYTS
jgi:hypothetical protein